MQTLRAQPDNSWVLVQAVAYNGDGSDRTAEQWDEVYAVAIEKGLGFVIDSAYYGLADSFGTDHTAIRKVLQTDIPAIIVLSNSKNLGMYQERLGAVYCVNVPQDKAESWQAVMNVTVRTLYSNPPRLEAEAIAKVLSDAQSLKQTEAEISEIRDNILKHNRSVLAAELGDSYSWIESTTGLFVKLLTGGFTDDQLAELKSQGILVLPNSRINLGGIHSDDIQRFSKAIASVL